MGAQPVFDCYIVVGALVTVKCARDASALSVQASEGGACSDVQVAARTSLLSLNELLAATGGALVMGCPEDAFCFTSVATDSRSAVAGGMFIPLVGEFQDGHDYVPAALEKGATVVLVGRDFAVSNHHQLVQWHHSYPGATFVAVDHTMYALQDAAAAYVQKFPDLVRIGVTGSSGKTTTKEILAAVLSTRFSVVMNQGNFNSETGLPLSVFQIRDHHQVGVFELGMNRRGEIAEIARVLAPSLGVITNIGTAHIGILGSKDAIAREKKQVFWNFSSGSCAFIPEMDSYRGFLREGLDCMVVEYGPSQVSSIRPCGLDGTSFCLEGVTMTLPLPGRANLYDALAAVAVARHLGLSLEEIRKGLESVQPLFGRSQVLRGDITFIQDCYNANPDSMAAALEFFRDLELDCGRKVLVLGDMLELGAESAAAHREAMEQAQKTGAALMVFLGDEMSSASATLEISRIGEVVLAGRSQETIDGAVEVLRGFLRTGDVVLLKGSRGMGLERITAALRGETA